MNAPVAKLAHLWHRDDLDWYVEPERCTRQLLEVEKFSDPIWDPACGAGNIIRACREKGHVAFGSDKVSRGAPFFQAEIDFLTCINPELSRIAPNIICNPPFFRAKGTEAFARKAVAEAAGKVAIFASLPFLAGQARGRGLFRDLPPTRVWIHSERPSCPPGEFLAAGNPPKGGTEDWCWLVWDHGTAAEGTRLGWLQREAA